MSVVTRDALVVPQGAFEALACWVAALHGRGELAAALARLAAATGGDGAVAVRVSTKDGRWRRIAGADARRRDAGTPPRRAIASPLEDALRVLRPGTTAFLSELRSEADFARREQIAEVLTAARLSDAALVPLGCDGRWADHLEIHFSEPVTRRHRILLSSMGPALAAAWSARLPGLARGLLATRRDAADAISAAEILHPSNPAGLSRSEYRVCMLVLTGLTARAIAAELEIRECTVRSHLRSVYAKTGAIGHVDLLHRLAVPVRDVLPEPRVA